MQQSPVQSTPVKVCLPMPGRSLFSPNGGTGARTVTGLFASTVSPSPRPLYPDSGFFLRPGSHDGRPLNRFSQFCRQMVHRAGGSAFPRLAFRCRGRPRAGQNPLPYSTRSTPGTARIRCARMNEIAMASGRTMANFASCGRATPANRRERETRTTGWKTYTV